MRKKNILVVDDTQFMLSLITNILTEEGYEVTTARSGEEALALLKEARPDLILLDGVMTGMSGIEVCAALRSNFRFNLIPIILLTGQTEEEEKLVGLELGADDYIAKPFVKRELIARVNNTLVRLERSRGANPLTGLRGNNDIEMELSRRINDNIPYAVLYFDLNSFKPYNDVYGFSNGDVAIKMTADIIADCSDDHGSPSDFVGHIGGDDFVIITEPDYAIKMSEIIVERFDAERMSLYNEKDIEKGYIVAKDRFGNEMQFTLIGISIAIVFSGNEAITTTTQLAEEAAKLKKKAKAQGKSAYAY